MNRNVAICEQGLKFEMAHAGKAARLAKRQPFLLKESQCKLPPDFRLTHVGGRQDLV